MFKHYKTLDDLFFNTPGYYLIGEGHTVEIDGVSYSLVKGQIHWFPSKYQHTQFKSTAILPATYVIREVNTGVSYVGSTKSMFNRSKEHRWMINHEFHRNPSIQKLLGSGEGCEFDLYAIFVANREQAYGFEQKLVGYFESKGLLANVSSVDVKLPTKGTKLTPEMKAEISRQIRSNPMRLEFISNLGKSAATEIMVDGVVYSSVKEAIATTGYSALKIRRLLKSDKHPDTRWTKRSSLNAGKKMPDHQRKLIQERMQNPENLAGMRAAHEKNKKVTVLNGVEYPSIKDAAKAAGVRDVSLIDAIKRLGQIDEKGRIVIIYTKQPYSCKPRSVMVDGVIYPSIKAAARSLGIRHTSVKGYLSSGRASFVSDSFE
jgi:hypothetical protein